MLTENRRRAEMPIYSFVKHQREKETTSVYSPHVLILEGILALHDPRILELLDMKVSWVFSHVRLLHLAHVETEGGRMELCDG